MNGKPKAIFLNLIIIFSLLGHCEDGHRQSDRLHHGNGKDNDMTNDSVVDIKGCVRMRLGIYILLLAWLVRTWMEPGEYFIIQVYNAILGDSNGKWAFYAVP